MIIVRRIVIIVSRHLIITNQREVVAYIVGITD